jgi:hypothetical protein
MTVIGWILIISFKNIRECLSPLLSDFSNFPQLNRKSKVRTWPNRRCSRNAVSLHSDGSLAWYESWFSYWLSWLTFLLVFLCLPMQLSFELGFLPVLYLLTIDIIIRLLGKQGISQSIDQSITQSIRLNVGVCYGLPSLLWDLDTFTPTLEKCDQWSLYKHCSLRCKLKGFTKSFIGR